MVVPTRLAHNAVRACGVTAESSSWWGATGASRRVTAFSNAEPGGWAYGCTRRDSNPPAAGIGSDAWARQVPSRAASNVSAGRTGLGEHPAPVGVVADRAAAARGGD